MLLRLLLFVLLAAPYFSVGQSTQRVLVIGIDGCRPDALDSANTPTIDSLIQTGLISPDALNDDVTFSGPGWSAIMTGVYSPKHLVTSNNFAGNDFATYPPIAKHIEDYDPGLNTASICHWAPINNSIVTTNADFTLNVSSDSALSAEAVDRITNHDPHYLFIHFDDVDHAGHAHGFSTTVTEYMDAIEAVDAFITPITRAITERPNYANENWLVLVTPDHGGIGTSHGGNSIEEQRVFFIASSPDITPDTILAVGTNASDSVLNCLGDSLELHFDGTNDNVQIPDAPNLNFGTTTDFTVECRVRTTTGGDVAIVGNKNWSSGANQGWVFSFNTGSGAWKVNIGDGTNRADINGTNINDNEWYTLSASFDRNGVVSLYQDGAFLGSTSIAAVGNVSTNQGVWMGTDINNAFDFTGRIAEVRVWDTLVSGADIATWHCTTVDNTHSNYNHLVGYWKLDEGTGTTATDASLSANNGAITNAVWKDHELVTTYDYSSTPRLADIPVSALAHLCIPIDPAWSLDGNSHLPLCPSLTTNGADSITNAQATLNASVHANSLNVGSVQFELGESIAYGTNITATPATITGSSATAVSADATGLERGKVYHYRVSGTVDGTPWYGSDQTMMLPPGNVVLFDGVNDYVAVPSHKDYQFGTSTDFTVEFWMQAAGAWAGDPAIISSKNWNAGTNAGWNIALSAGGNGIDVNVGDGTNRADLDAGTVSDAEWHHVAATFDRSALVSLYIDGRLAQSTSMAGVGDIDNSLNIGMAQDGSYGYGNFFRGRLDEVRLWNTLRTQDELRENMHLSLVGNETGLVGYWRMDTDGTTINELINNNHGTITNGGTPAASVVALGYGASARQTVTASGSYAFGATGVTMDFPAAATYPNGELVVSRLEGAPDEDPAGLSTTSRCYWLVRNFGTNTTFTQLTSLQLSSVGEVSAAAQATPSDVLLFKRSSNENGTTWGAAHATGTAATQGADGSVTFGGGNNITSFSQLMVGDQGTPVPVELMRFTALAQDEAVAVEWATASEVNTAWFSIERSRDGRTFTELARLPAAEHSNSVRSYEYMDYAPHTNRSYYRLRTIDVDGSSALSNVATVYFGGAESIFVGPNPTGEAGQLTIRSQSSEQLLFTLYNTLGQPVRTVQVLNNATISVAELPAGVYGFLLARNGKHVDSGSLVVGR